MQLLTNAFELPVDGWYQISSLGEFPHNSTGLLQVVDDESCRAMADHFGKLAQAPNFPGVLIDFDHFSLDHSKPSEAAGWIVKLEQRPSGLWAQVRWSDRGEEAVRGGRYRFISPVWRQDECMDLGNKRVRPMRLINAAVTNDPNISGMVPLSNRPGEPMDDEQRKAMFARMGHGGGGGGGGGGTGAGQPVSIGRNDPTRQSEDRIADYDRQIGELQAQRTPPPVAPDYSQVNTRQLQRELMSQGAGTNEVRAAVDQAEASNFARRMALRDLRADARRAYPGNSKKQAAYVDKRLKAEREAHEKEFAAWQRRDNTLRDRVDKLTAERNTEAIRAKEESFRSAQKQMQEDFAEDQRNQRQQERDLRQQIEDDKREARRQQAELEKAQRKAQGTDAATAYRQELNRRRTYWQAASRGDWDQAKAIYPSADHDQNRRDLEELAPPSPSRANLKAYDSALKQLQYEAP